MGVLDPIVHVSLCLCLMALHWYVKIGHDENILNLSKSSVSSFLMSTSRAVVISLKRPVYFPSLENQIGRD